MQELHKASVHTNNTPYINIPAKSLSQELAIISLTSVLKSKERPSAGVDTPVSSVSITQDVHGDIFAFQFSVLSLQCAFACIMRSALSIAIRRFFARGWALTIYCCSCWKPYSCWSWALQRKWSSSFGMSCLQRGPSTAGPQQVYSTLGSCIHLFH